MCGIIGFVVQQPTEKQLSFLKNVMIQSKIRGMHATGISYLKNQEIITEIHTVPADKFPFKFQNYLNEDGNLYMIGHCRYSTSDLEFNQPLYSLEKSIVHNGVITQELHENWKSLYGYECITKNDSELILHSSDPLKEFNHMSMSVCELRKDKTIRFYRNGKRPLYLTKMSNACIITSTMDIPSRAGAPDLATKIDMNQYVTVDSNLNIVVEEKELEGKDFQHYEIH
jgi:glutamine phosphoribosylpyrophosphate amidotransferase